MVIPLYDNDPFEAPFRPYVTWSLIGLNLLAFAGELLSPDTDAVLVAWGVTPMAVTTGQVHGYVTLLTSMFLHGGWLHLLGNMLYLHVFGDDIEATLGHARYLLFYLASGIGAALFYVVCDVSSVVPMVGASGAISGVLAAYLMLKPCAKVTVLVFFRPLRIRAMWAIGLWGALQLLDMMSGDSSDPVAYSAHFGGLIAGAALFFFLRPGSVTLFECLEHEA